MPIAHVEEDPEENSKGVRMMTIYVVLTWDAHVEEDPEEDSKGDKLEDGCHEDRGSEEDRHHEGGHPLVPGSHRLDKKWPCHEISTKFWTVTTKAVSLWSRARSYKSILYKVYFLYFCIFKAKTA